MVVDLHRQAHVLRRRQERDQVGLLEDEAQVLAAEAADVDLRLRWLSKTVLPPMTMRPALGGRIRPMSVSSVDLPAPLGPSRATISPRATVKRGIAHGDDFGVAAAVDLGQAAGLQNGIAI